MVVQFHNVSARYGHGPEVLHDIALEFQAGQITCLSGPSGSGKTTLLKLIYLGLRPSAGTLTIFERNAATLRPQERTFIHQNTGVIFQDFRLLDHLSVFDNVALPMRLQSSPEATVRKHVSELLTWVGLEDAFQSLPPLLSGGQKQRVAIARAVIARPKLILADEPAGNLDHETAQRAIRLLLELPALGTTVIIATHNTRDFQKPSIRHLALKEGHICAHEPDRGEP